MKSRYLQLPERNSNKPVRIQMSEKVIMTCPCNYHGFAKMIIGRTPYPLYVCPQCNRVAQFMTAKK